MRVARMLPFLIIAQIGWAMCAGGQASPTPDARLLTIRPTAIEELTEFRMNTGTKAVLNDGTLSAVYVTHVPATGCTYLNFHVDVASETGSVVLHTKDIRLEGSAEAAAVPRGRIANGATAPTNAERATYTPLDWFIDTGSDEVRGESLTLSKGIVQFTIEVPRADLDNLTLFMHFQRIGTVREIREQIAKDRN